MGVNDYINIGNIIKTMRIIFKYSQKEMANKLGIAPSTYSGYETNYREPNKNMIEKIAEIFGVNSCDLILLGAFINIANTRLNKSIIQKYEFSKEDAIQELIALDNILKNMGLETDFNIFDSFYTELCNSSKNETAESILLKVVQNNYHSNK